MPGEGAERDGALREPEQILAWLEELSRIGTKLELEFPDPDQLPVTAKVRTVVEESATCSLQFSHKPGREPVRGQRMRVVFPMDGKRFQTDLTYEGRGNYLEYRFNLPTGINHAERRDSVRVKMRPNDKFNVVALEGLFEGLGLTGILVDLSLGGCCFRAERVIRIRDERRLPITTDMLAPGTPLALVRLTNLPHLPLVECGAHLRLIRQAEEGVLLALQFQGLGAFETGILGKFLSERVPGYTLGFPHKRRIHDLTEAERMLPQPPAPAPELPADPSLQLKDEPDEGQGPEGDAGTGEELHDALTDKERLNKLRKRGKRILIVMGDELERVLFMATLHQDGYRCLFEAKSMVQALNHNRKLALDLLVVDQTVGHVGALELVEVIRDQGLPKEVPVMVLKRSVDHRLTLAAKAGKVNCLVDHPVDFPGTMKNAMESLLGIL